MPNSTGLTDHDLDAIAEQALAYRRLGVTLCPPQPLVDDLLRLVRALREERDARHGAA